MPKERKERITCVAALTALHRPGISDRHSGGWATPDVSDVPLRSENKKVRCEGL